MRTLTTLLLAASTLCVQTLQAQSDKTVNSEQKPAVTYRLTFVVTQLVKGKLESRRTYAAIYATSHENGSLRAGARVPMPVATPAISSNVSTQYQYIDVGVNFDFHTPGSPLGQIREGTLPLEVKAEVSSYGPATSPTVVAPIIRSDSWQSDFVLPFDKPTLLFSSQDPSVDETTQVELTVTRM